MIKMNKKGELTTHQLVGLIILIVSFAVILFLLFRLNLGETTNKEICHNSVIMKGKDITSKFSSSQLDCKTSYLCITGGGECEGINPSETKKIDLDKENSREEIMKIIADEMVDCWWMFGEGKIDYVGSSVFDKKSCALCSIIAFDKKISEIEDITSREIYELTNFKIEDSYLENTIDFNNQYSILTGINNEGFFWEVIKFVNPLPYLIVKSGDGEKGVIFPIILEKTKVNDLECGEFITKA